MPSSPIWASSYSSAIFELMDTVIMRCDQVFLIELDETEAVLGFSR